jgi:subtilisin family serine protease
MAFPPRFPRARLKRCEATPTWHSSKPIPGVHASDTQSPATWGLDRIDQRNRPLSNSHTYNATRAGVTASIIDTGIRFSHTQFGGRAITGFDSVDGGSADDCNGHGTHVAGTVGGSVHGVAKGVRLVGVRALNCQGSGSTSGVIAGVDWVTGNHGAGQPAIANMSLGGGANSALDTAVNNSINDGVSYAVAAGNSNANACNSSPSRVGAAMTVGSTTTSSDARSSFSNFGTCLDIFAPGSSITSTWYTSNTATNTISGISMASPHVAGVAALYLQGSPSASPATIRNASPRHLPAFCPAWGRVRRTCCCTRCSAPLPYHRHRRPVARWRSPTTARSRGTGDSGVHPSGTYFYSSSSGTHRGCVRGPSGTDFDLYL